MGCTTSLSADSVAKSLVPGASEKRRYHTKHGAAGSVQIPTDLLADSVDGVCYLLAADLAQRLHRHSHTSPIRHLLLRGTGRWCHSEELDIMSNSYSNPRSNCCQRPPGRCLRRGITSPSPA